jgi:hypothetical protein
MKASICFLSILLLLFGCAPSSRFLLSEVNPTVVTCDKVEVTINVYQVHVPPAGQAWSGTDSQYLQCLIKNIGDSGLELAVDQCSIIDPLGFAHRCVTGEARVDQMNMAQPNLPIPQGGQVLVLLAPQDLIKEKVWSGTSHYYVDYITPPATVKVSLALKNKAGEIFENAYEVFCPSTVKEKRNSESGY